MEAGFVAVVLAAGIGRRMGSDLPKVLHPLCGRPLLHHVLEAAGRAGAVRRVVVVGHRRDDVLRSLEGWEVEAALQPEPLGTGDAVRSALPRLVGESRPIAILNGDTPLLRPETLADLVAEHRRSGAALTLLSAALEDPAGYGRVVRNPAGEFDRIVEERDATEAERALREVNTGVYVAEAGPLARALASLSPRNAQGEYYLTDVPRSIRLAGLPVRVVQLQDPSEALGVNDRLQLAMAEAILRERIRRRWMLAGVRLVDPAAVYIDAGVELGRDTTVYPFTSLEGNTRVGENCRVGPWARLVDVTVEPGARVERVTLARVRVGRGAWVGAPSSRAGGGDEWPRGG